MKYLIKIGFVFCIWLLIPPSQAAMISTSDLVVQQSRAQLVDLLQHEEVRQELIDLGIDPAAAIQRISHMTNEEI